MICFGVLGGFGALELYSSPRRLSQKFHSMCKPNDVQPESKMCALDSFQPCMMRIFCLRKQTKLSLTKTHKPHREQILGTWHWLHASIASLQLQRITTHIGIASVFQSIRLPIQASKLQPQLAKRLLCGQTSS